MEKTISEKGYIVGWSTKQANTHIRVTTNRFGEFEYIRALSKYNLVSNRQMVRLKSKECTHLIQKNKSYDGLYSPAWRYAPRFALV